MFHIYVYTNYFSVSVKLFLLDIGGKRFGPCKEAFSHHFARRNIWAEGKLQGAVG
jgi:hypothetical protein